MPVIVKSPHDHLGLFQKIHLVLVKRIVPQICDFIGGTPKCRLMSDYKVMAGSLGTLEQTEGGHEGRRNAGDRRVRVTNFELIGGWSSPRNANVFPNSRHDFPSGQLSRRLRSHQARRQEKATSCQLTESPSGYCSSAHCNPRSKLRSRMVRPQGSTQSELRG